MDLQEVDHQETPGAGGILVEVTMGYQGGPKKVSQKMPSGLDVPATCAFMFV